MKNNVSVCRCHFSFHVVKIYLISKSHLEWILFHSVPFLLLSTRSSSSRRWGSWALSKKKNSFVFHPQTDLLLKSTPFRVFGKTGPYRYSLRWADPTTQWRRRRRWWSELGRSRKNTKKRTIKRSPFSVLLHHHHLWKYVLRLLFQVELCHPPPNSVPRIIKGRMLYIR